MYFINYSNWEVTVSLSIKCVKKGWECAALKIKFLAGMDVLLLIRVVGSFFFFSSWEIPPCSGRISALSALEFASFIYMVENLLS